MIECESVVARSGSVLKKRTIDMYVGLDMVEIGLDEGQNWPSEVHETVAQMIIIGNPNVKNRDRLMEVVQAILKVPVERIRNITYQVLVDEFKMPDVVAPV